MKLTWAWLKMTWSQKDAVRAHARAGPYTAAGTTRAVTTTPASTNAVCRSPARRLVAIEIGIASRTMGYTLMAIGIAKYREAHPYRSSAKAAKNSTQQVTNNTLNCPTWMLPHDSTKKIIAAHGNTMSR